MGWGFGGLGGRSVDIYLTLGHVVEGVTNMISQVLMFLTIAVR